MAAPSANTEVKAILNRHERPVWRAVLERAEVVDEAGGAGDADHAERQQDRLVLPPFDGDRGDDERRHPDDEPAEGRRTGLVLVFRLVLADLLADLLAAQEAHDGLAQDEREDERRRAGDERVDHAAPSRRGMIVSSAWPRDAFNKHGVARW